MRLSKHVYGASYAHNERARLISEIGLSGFFRLVPFLALQCSQDSHRAFDGAHESIAIDSCSVSRSAAAAYYQRVPRATDLQGRLSSAS